MTQTKALGPGLYRPRYRDSQTGELRESNIIWARYYRNGKKFRVSTETENPRVARKFRANALAAIAR